MEDTLEGDEWPVEVEVCVGVVVVVIELTPVEETGEPGEGRSATGITSGGRSASSEFNCWSCWAVSP